MPQSYKARSHTKEQPGDLMRLHVIIGEIFIRASAHKSSKPAIALLDQLIDLASKLLKDKAAP